MTERTMRYLLLRIYSNEELKEYLNRMLEEGWILEKNRGNFLTFRKQTMKKARLCIVTAICSKPKPKEDEAVQEYLSIAKRAGWQNLCIGDFEGVLPAKRRLYFYTTNSRPEPFEYDAVVAFQNAYRAQRSTLLWMILWTVLTAAAWLTTIAFMLQEGFHPVIALLDGSLLASAVCSLRLWRNRKRYYDQVVKEQPVTTSGLRKLERYTLASWAAVAVSTVLFLLV